jgi:hypothetical protein
MATALRGHVWQASTFQHARSEQRACHTAAKETLVAS